VKRFFIIFCLIVLSACSRLDITDVTPTGSLFDPVSFPEFHLHVSEAEWSRLLEAFDRDPDTQEFVWADLVFKQNGSTVNLSGIGLRLKGNTARRRPESDGRFHHAHFGLDFNHYEQDDAHAIGGVRRVDLKWFKDDATYAREIFCYDLFARFGVWTAPRDVYCRLWIQVGAREEAYFGVYGMLEHINERFIGSRSRFGGAGGNLWKCRSADLRSPDAVIGADDNQSWFQYELKTNKKTGFEPAKEQLQHFIRGLNSHSGDSFNEWLPTVMDVDLLLRSYAVNVAVGMWDDLWNNANNYYLYFNTTDPQQYKVFFIPYDYDNTLGTSLHCGVQSDAGRQDPYRWGPADHPLMGKVLQNPVWRAAYRKYLQELCAGDCSEQAAVARIKAWQEKIGPYVSNDTGEDMSIEDVPAGWGNHHEYRVVESGDNNFFRVKAAAVAAMK